MGLLYEAFFLAGFLLYLPNALWRRRLPHAGWRMRLGRFPESVTRVLRARPSIWVHAVSVGEVLAARPLLRGLRRAYPDTPLTLSTITPGGFSVASSLGIEDLVPIYFPLDLRGCVRRSLEVLRPRALLLMESELWPQALRLTRARGTPIVVVNGRLSPRTFRRYRLVRPWLKTLWATVDRFLMQTREDAERLQQLGAPRDRVQVVGGLKWDAGLQARPAADVVQATARRLGLHEEDVVIVAGSTHRGEETVVLEALRAVRSATSPARLILAPRHLERLAEVEVLVQRAGFSIRRTSQLTEGSSWEVALVDTFGELPQYYSLATIVFIGGSLIPHGGQNPLEATSLGKPILFGPSMHNFADIAQRLLEHHAARQVPDGAGLIRACWELLADRRAARDMGARARVLTKQSQGATQRTLDTLQHLLATH